MNPTSEPNAKPEPMDAIACLRCIIWQLDRMDDLPPELEDMVREAKESLAKTA